MGIKLAAHLRRFLFIKVESSAPTLAPSSGVPPSKSSPGEGKPNQSPGADGGHREGANRGKASKAADVAASSSKHEESTPPPPKKMRLTGISSVAGDYAPSLLDPGDVEDEQRIVPPKKA